MATINNMTTTPTHDNDGTPYTIAVDDAKEGAQLFDLTPWFKGRVGDNLSPLDMLWRHQGRISDLTNLKPVISGNVGHYSFEKDDQGVTQMVMASDASTVYQEGDPSDCQAGGRVTYHFPSQVFPKEGAFKGYLGLMDTTTGKLVSSIDVWFKVLPGIAQMGIACDYYIDVLDKAIANFAEKARQHDIDYQAALTKARQDFESQTNQALAELQAKYDQDVAASHDASLKARTSLSDLADTTASINAQIKANDIVKRNEYLADKAKLEANITNTQNDIDTKLSQVDVTPEAVTDYSQLITKYPNGKEGLVVTADTEHKYLYVDGQWLDKGLFVFNDLKPSEKNELYTKSSDNIIVNPDLNDDAYGWTKAGNWEANPDKKIGNSMPYGIHLETKPDSIQYMNQEKILVQGQTSLSIGIHAWPIDALSANLQVMFFDKSGALIEGTDKAVIFPQNSPIGFTLVKLEDISVPASAYTATLSINMADTGTIIVCRPQLNFGEVLIPYSLSEVAQVAGASSLPTFNFKTDRLTTDTKVVTQFTYQNGEQVIKGYAQIALQGDSSRGYEKKNYKIKLYSDTDLKTKVKN